MAITVNRIQNLSEDYLHKEYPKQFRKDEFWKQIKRTVNGKPVSDSEIKMIVDQVAGHLALQSDDFLLDLGCGNGALASHFFHRIHRYVGVDFSDFLLEVADEYFAKPPGIQFCKADIRDVLGYSQNSENVNKLLLYGCISYLSKRETQTLLASLRDQFSCLTKVFIGNIPRREKAKDFFAARGIESTNLEDPKSAIGVWWGIDELKQLALQSGFKPTCHVMPKGFYGRTYRFDLLLEK